MPPLLLSSRMRRCSVRQFYRATENPGQSKISRIRVSTVSGEPRLTVFVSEAVGQFRSRAQAKLAVDAAQVSLDGFWTEEERRGDLAIRGPDGYLERDLQLLQRELLRA